MALPTVALVIPTLEEERSLPRILPPLLAQADEVVVSDGGSRDSTVEIARRLGARVVTGPQGRGGQLNRGAAATESDVLLFVHADTELPAGAVAAVRAAVAAGAIGGGFRLRFDRDTPVWRLGGRLVNLRTRLTGVPLGDQAQFVTREAFVRLGGFRDWPILEDLDLGRRMKRAGPTRVLAPRVVTAARRYEKKGLLRTIANNWLIWWLYFLGVSPHRLARLYRPQS
jgi:rSAM/selenodomain-associated transferase 2